MQYTVLRGPSLTLVTCRDGSVARLPLCGAAQGHAMVPDSMTRQIHGPEQELEHRAMPRRLPQAGHSGFLQEESAQTAGSFLDISMRPFLLL